MAEVAVVIPWRYEAGREPALTFVRHRLAHRVVIGQTYGDEWVKAEAIARGLALTNADVVVIHDADVVVPDLDVAIEAVIDGAPWAVPHGHVRRLDEASTAKVLAGGPLCGRLTEGAYWGHEGGGVVVIRREVYEDCPMDARFVGWGREDDAWALALRTLYGQPWRGMEPLWHLWHPEPPRSNRKYGNEANNALYRRYWEASGHGVEAMRDLVDEAVAATRNRV